MKLLMAIVIGGVSVLVLAVAIAAGLGAATPRQHTASSVAEFHQPAESLYAALADFEHAPRWRSDLSGVRRLPDRNGHAIWEQQAGDGVWPLEIREATPPSRLVTATADTSQGLGGTWTFVIEPRHEGARVTITETGTVDHLLMRFVTHRFVDLHATQKTFLRDLGRRFGETVAPESR
ncbi:MAG: SRPBCC family protein [Candidatus Eisenbacteria bacterium]